MATSQDNAAGSDDDHSGRYAAHAPSGARMRGITDAALSLFVDYGYHGTTMKDIAAAMGIRAPSLYNHVGSKQLILQEIVIGTEQELLAEFHQATDGVDGPVEALRAAMEAFVRHHANNPREAIVGNREVASLAEPARSRLVQMRRDHEHAIRGLIEHGCSQGVFSVEHPHLASFGMLEMGVGVARWFRSGGALSAEEVARAYGELAIRMCRP